MYEVIWSEFAEIQPDLIYDYYNQEAGISIARKVVEAIIISTEILESHPYSGPVEPMLNGRSVVYRYLVVNNYKLIYSVDENRMAIKIADVFDTRQFPQKLQRKK